MLLLLLCVQASEQMNERDKIDDDEKKPLKCVLSTYKSNLRVSIRERARARTLAIVPIQNCDCIRETPFCISLITWITSQCQWIWIYDKITENSHLPLSFETLQNMSFCSDFMHTIIAAAAAASAAALLTVISNNATPKDGPSSHLQLIHEASFYLKLQEIIKLIDDRAVNASSFVHWLK